MKITVIGSGYVGLVSGACLAELSNDVICLDVDPRKIEILNNGDVRHPLADISKSSMLLGYNPTHHIGEGLKVAIEWYVRHVAKQQGATRR